MEYEIKKLLKIFQMANKIWIKVFLVILIITAFMLQVYPAKENLHMTNMKLCWNQWEVFHNRKKNEDYQDI